MHDHFTVMEPDENFDTGSFQHLIAGNEGRVLDGRRTPGYIERLDWDSGLFVWRITAFEDKGKCWEIPVEDIPQYQFRKNCTLLPQNAADRIAQYCRKFQKSLQIPAEKERFLQTNSEIEHQEAAARQWLSERSTFLKKGKQLSFSAVTGDTDLFCDLARYMEEHSVLDLENRTAAEYLLNPYSGEWMKGMKITMAEMGLLSYNGTVIRSSNTFSGMGEKSLRKEYIILRLAFLRALFRMCGYTEVPLFRGVSSEANFFQTPQTLLSGTFSSDTAAEFAGIQDSSKFRSCYWVKFFCKTEDLFMTFLETRALNERYQEQEAVFFYREQFRF